MRPQTLKSITPQLGKTFIDRLVNTPLVTINGTTWTRDRLVRAAACGNFAAAKRLEHALVQLGVDSSAQLNGALIEELAKVKGVGETTIYVLLCIQEATGESVSKWPQTWRTYVSKYQRTGGGRRRRRGAAQAATANDTP